MKTEPRAPLAPQDRPDRHDRARPMIELILPSTATLAMSFLKAPVQAVGDHLATLITTWLT